MALRPCVSIGADTVIGLHPVHTHSSILAGPGSALIHFVLAVRSGEASAADAGVGVHAIFAGPTIKTRALSTVLYVGLTDGPGVSRSTRTHIAVNII